jgi:hypothetical protein
MNDPDWEQDDAEFEKNAAAMREVTIPPAAFAAVRQRVLSEMQAKKRRAAWWTWSAVAAAACVAMVCVAYLAPGPQRPRALVARKDPPRIEWTARPVAQRVHHKSSGRLLRGRAPVRKTEPLAVVKMLTDDPNVIIIWLVDQKGDSL